MADLKNPENNLLTLVTGATGYVGGRLIPRLLAQGYRVRVLVRGGAERLNGRSWQNQVEVAVGDVLDPASLTEPLAGVTAAYYLIHSMSGNEEFSQRDITAAQNFSQAAAKADVKRIIYLGGWATRTALCRNICAHARRQGSPYANLAWPSPNFGPV